MLRRPHGALISAVLAAGLAASGGSARAIETWVGTNGEIRVVPGTEDPLPPVAPVRSRPSANPSAPAHLKQRSQAGVPTKAKPSRPHGQGVPATTGSITPTNPPRPKAKPGATPADPRQPPPVAQQPLPPPIPPVLWPPARPPLIDPGNPIILVDPSRDTVSKTKEDDDGTLDPAADPTGVPGSLPINPLDPNRAPSPTAAAPLQPRGTMTVPPSARSTSGAVRQGVPVAPATPTTAQADPNAPAPAPTVVSAQPRVPAPLAGPVTPVQPQAPLTTGAIAQAPQPATTPNPRGTLDDPLTDPQAAAYDPVGIRINSFIWRPAIEASAGATTNIQGSATGTASSALRLAPEIVGQSDWSRHQLGVDVRGSFTEYPADWALFRPTVSATVNGRIDFSEDTQLALKTSYGLDKLPSTSALSAAGSTAPGLQQTVSASAGLTRDVGRFAVTLRGEVDRTDYQLDRNVITPAAGLNNTQVIAALRGTYALSAGIKPFLEVQADARRYDGPSQDSSTAAPVLHDTTGAAAKGGVTLDLGPILSGEAAAGYGYETPTVRSLQKLHAFTVDENLVWSPTRLTRVTISTVTAIEPSLLAGASGAVSRTVGVKVSNDLMRNLTVDLGGSYLARTYTGVARTETLSEVTSGLTWKINPSLQTFVRGTYDAFSSSAHTDDYKAATIFAGVRLQK